MHSATADVITTLEVTGDSIFNTGGANVTATYPMHLYTENNASIMRFERFNSSASNYSIVDVMSTFGSGLTSFRLRAGTVANRTANPPVLMTLDETGQLAMGTTVPRATLHIRQNIDEAAGLRIQNNEGWMELGSDDTNVYMKTQQVGGTGPFDILTIEHATQEVTFLGGSTNVKVLEIQGGSDLSESFDVENNGAPVEPGMVVSIDPAKPGELKVSYEAYDKKVAGIVSGAGGLNPGMVMGQADTIAFGEHPVALTGRVYCYVDATFGAVEPGDLLTTSSTPGHAMKAQDHNKAHGAVLGKAMTPLAEGERGLVLVLVNLQ